MSPHPRWAILPVAAGVARLVAALVGATGAACESPTMPSGVRITSPPAIYTTWWAQMKQCSGLSGDLGRITWLVVPCEAGETGFKCEATADGLCGGEWIAPHTIRLGGPNQVLPDGYASDAFTVKHEMLHDLMGSAEHTDLFTVCHVALR